MDITLRNVGIIKDSTITVKGLTVITGKNNSGKTTVGKALYALVDSVSNLAAKATKDRNLYVLQILDDISELLSPIKRLRAIQDTSENSDFEESWKNYPKIQRVFQHSYKRRIPLDEAEKFARDLYAELKQFDSSFFLRDEFCRQFISNVYKTDNLQAIVNEPIEKACALLDNLFDILSRDTELIDFARQNISETLRVEFSNQIQPIRIDVEESSILLKENDSLCFDIQITGNKVKKSSTPVYFSSPYKAAYFVDDPFILDNPLMYGLMHVTETDSADVDSILNPSRILPHREKLQRTLRSKNETTILQQNVLEDSLQSIKKEIDNIIPGTFESLSDGDYYVHDGKKLKFSNLATGSKMFSIIKVMLERGLIDDASLLVLDEPEAHLHPSWQNHFAEIIVLLVKELNTDILLTTHSSNFVLALDAYMRKHSIEEKTTFYRTEVLDDGMVQYTCVDDNIGSIYQDFLQYFSEVKTLRNHYLKKGGEDE